MRRGFPGSRKEPPMTSQSKITALAGAVLLFAAMPGSVLLPGLAHADDRVRCRVNRIENPYYYESHPVNTPTSELGPRPSTDIQCRDR